MICTDNVEAHGALLFPVSSFNIVHVASAYHAPLCVTGQEVVLPGKEPFELGHMVCVCDAAAHKRRVAMTVCVLGLM